MAIRIPFETYMRQAAVQMLRDFAQDASIGLQTYEGRPRSINPPTAYVERMRESIIWSPGLRQRTVQLDIRVLWGLFDSREAVLQRDTFIDQFIDWTSDRPHVAFGSTVIEPRSVEDDPDFTPDWLPSGNETAYFSSTLTLEGFAGGY